MNKEGISDERTRKIDVYADRLLRQILSEVYSSFDTLNEEEKNTPDYLLAARTVLEGALTVFSLELGLSKEDVISHLFDVYDGVEEWYGKLKDYVSAKRGENKDKSNK